MKKTAFTFTATLLLALSFQCINTYAATNNKIDKIVPVSQGMALEKKDAPNLVLEATTDHTKNFKFTLRLEGAIWTYDESGTLTKGITYQKYTDSLLKFEVDISKFDAKKNNINIPLLTEITSEGDAILYVESDESTVSGGSYSFTTKAMDQLSLKSEGIIKLTEESTLLDVTLDDSSTTSIKKGKTYNLRLGNDFRFVGTPEIVATGKYKNAVSFQADKDNFGDATLTITKDTDEAVGTITLKSTQIKKTKNSAFGDVALFLTINNQTLSTTVAKFIKSQSNDTPLSLLYLNELSLRPIIVGEGLSGERVEIKIDGKTLGTALIGDNGRFTMQYTETEKDLAEGTHSIEIAYTNKSLSSQNGNFKKSFTTELPYGIAFTIGSDSYTAEGVSKNLDAPAYMDENGRTMLPLRAFVNSLGISDDNVEWNEKTGTVIISNYNGNEIKIKIGENEIVVNGISKKIDTKAVIVNGRTFLPMRPLLNALGINDNNIIWKPISQTVIITVK